MKLLLIDVGYDCEELNEPLGIEVLSSYLLSKIEKVEVTLYCVNIEKCDYLQLLTKVDPDMIGVSTHINTWEKTDKIYRLSKKFFEEAGKEMFMIIGGIIGTYEFKEFLKEHENTVCIIGEGERALEQIVTALLEMTERKFVNLIKEIKDRDFVNLAYVDGGVIKINHRSSLPDLTICDYKVDHYYLEDIIKRKGIVRMEASRGCPWNQCTFCVLPWKYSGYLWRPYSLKKVIDEIIDLSDKGARTIYFTDEEFIAGDARRINELIEKIMDAKKNLLIDKNLEFIVSTSVRVLTGKCGINMSCIEEILKKMNKAGFRSFFLGIESGSNTQLKRFCKGDSVEEIELALQLLNKYEIEVDIGYILFDPLMTINELAESLDFLERNNLNDHISRFAKRLRIVPYTKYCYYSGINFMDYDSDLVEYEYKFSDEKVQTVYNLYSKWEDKHLHVTHSLQATIREARTSSRRDEIILELENIRHKEFYILKYLVDSAINNPDVLDKIESSMME